MKYLTGRAGAKLPGPNFGVRTLGSDIKTELRDRRWLFPLAIGGVAIAVAATYFAYRPAEAPPDTRPVAVSKQPAVNCVFYDFTHASIVVAFNFAVTQSKDAGLRFDQISLASRDGTRQTFDAPDRPIWSYARDEDGAPTIASPDGATRIVLYGLKPDTPGEFFIETGLRSNTYRNLDGKCHQANFAGSGVAGAEPRSGGAASASPP